MKKKYFSGDMTDSNKYEASPKEKTYVQSAEVTLIFKQNRKFHLHIGNTTLAFNGGERVRVPRWVIEHPDFEDQKKYFLVKEA